MSIKRIKLYKQNGTAIVEYGLPLVLIVIISLVSMPLLVKHLKTGISNILGSSVNSKNINLNSLGSKKPSNHSISLHSKNAPVSSIISGLSLVQTKQNAIQIIETAGVNGYTNTLADFLMILAQKLLAIEAITSEQSQSLINLANQGHAIALIEWQIEESAKNAENNPQSFKNSEVMYDGSMVPIWQVQLALYHNQDPALSTEYNKFNSFYQVAQTSGALTNPEVKVYVNNAVSNINVLMDLIGGKIGELFTLANQNNKTTSSSSLNSFITSNIVSDYTHLNSATICTSGFAQDYGTLCYP